MLNLRIVSLIILALAVVASVPCFAQQSEVERQIQNLEEKMNAAYAANDLPAYFSYYSSDFTQWLPEGRTDLPQYEKMWTAFIHSGGKVQLAEPLDMHLQVNPSGDTVVASYLLHVKTQSPNGKVSDENYHESDVWFKRNGEWKVVHLHYSPSKRK